MSQLKQLRAATTLSDVARLLEIKPGMLSFLLYKKPKGALYAKFDIPKRHGGTREIWAPDKDLKLVQHRLANLLQNCVEEINAGRGHVEDGKRHGVAHGFKRKHTIMTNARVHVTRRYVFNVDLHDFFGTINFGRVRGFFLKDKNFALQEKVATVIAQIACHENKLPQGSPCSPVISNLIGHVMDIMLVRLASATGCSYSRYADDLTFSSNKSKFSSRVATQDEDDKDLWLPGQGLKRLVAKAGFSFNDKKTRMQYRDSRQDVTGLVVNRKVNVPATYRYTVRAMVDHALKKGRSNASSRWWTQLASRRPSSSPGRTVNSSACCRTSIRSTSSTASSARTTASNRTTLRGEPICSAGSCTSMRFTRSDRRSSFVKVRRTTSTSGMRSSDWHQLTRCSQQEHRRS